jgi:molybdopterin-binding protein
VAELLISPGGRIKLREEGIMKISARNVLRGKVKQLKHGVVNTEVIIEMPSGNEIVSMITKESAEKLGMAVGKEVYAVIKASNVMIALD